MDWIGSAYYTLAKGRLYCRMACCGGTDMSDADDVAMRASSSARQGNTSRHIATMKGFIEGSRRPVLTSVARAVDLGLFNLGKYSLPIQRLSAFKLRKLVSESPDRTST